MKLQRRRSRNSIRTDDLSAGTTHVLRRRDPVCGHAFNMKVSQILRIFSPLGHGAMCTPLWGPSQHQGWHLLLPLMRRINHHTTLLPQPMDCTLGNRTSSCQAAQGWGPKDAIGSSCRSAGSIDLRRSGMTGSVGLSVTSAGLRLDTPGPACTVIRFLAKLSWGGGPGDVADEDPFPTSCHHTI